MVNLHIEVGIFLDMLTYIQMKGKNIKGKDEPLLEDCLLLVKESSIECISMDEQGAVAINVILKLNKTDISEEGNIPIEIEKVIQRLKRFSRSDRVKIEFTDTNKLVIYRKSPKLRITETMINENSIKSKLDELQMEFKDGKWYGSASGNEMDYTYVKLDASQFKEVVEDGEQIKHRSFPITIKGEEIDITVIDEGSGSGIDRGLTYTELTNYEDMKLPFSYGFGNIFSRLTGEIEIWIAPGLPMLIRVSEKDLTVIYLLSQSELAEDEPEPKPEKPKKADKKEPTPETSEDEGPNPDDYTEAGQCAECEDETMINPNTGNCFECDS